MSHRVNSTILGRNSQLFCTLTLITMQGHKNENNERDESTYTVYFDSRVQNYSNMVIERINKVKGRS